MSDMEVEFRGLKIRFPAEQLPKVIGCLAQNQSSSSKEEIPVTQDIHTDRISKILSLLSESQKRLALSICHVLLKNPNRPFFDVFRQALDFCGTHRSHTHKTDAYLTESLEKFVRLKK